MNDYEIREALCNYIDDTHFDKVRIIDELVIGEARADIVIVTNFLTGYEIKGDTDSYTRLPNQIKEYDKYFQQNYLVVGASHRKSAPRHVPPYWGIMCFFASEKGIQTETLREAESNPEFHLERQLELLWHAELVNILRYNKLPECSGKNKSRIRKFLFENVPKSDLQKQICEELFERLWTH